VLLKVRSVVFWADYRDDEHKRSHDSDEDSLDGCIVWNYDALPLLNDRRLQRWGPLSTLKPKLGKGNPLALSNFGVMFAVLHLVWYTVWGETRVYGNRVAFIVTLLSWSSLIQGVLEEWQHAGTSLMEGLGEEESEGNEIADEKPAVTIKGKKMGKSLRRKRSRGRGPT